MLTIDQLESMWVAYRAGRRVTCASCEGDRFALGVNEDEGYRWCCLGCGRHSEWFAVDERGVRLAEREPCPATRRTPLARRPLRPRAPRRLAPSAHRARGA